MSDSNESSSKTTASKRDAVGTSLRIFQDAFDLEKGRQWKRRRYDVSLGKPPMEMDASQPFCTGYLEELCPCDACYVADTLADIAIDENRSAGIALASGDLEAASAYHRKASIVLGLANEKRSECSMKGDRDV